ncbi:L-fuculokinase [Flammeovirga pectinis]|uniref:L-fuculokinase n=1 Tax=Flammeovirga pectinis TaxID=2494373 RepID=A0A3Q9FQT8_9BACT|nr:L-fuculokinase [Flammeovirga pectinis]AZQ64954.1 L-fuculokinase [Flammeovirga pectinis]
MEKNIVMVLDCGATNVRAIAIDQEGQLIAKHAVPNVARKDPNHSDYTIWDIEEILDKLSFCTKKVLAEIDPKKVTSIGVSTFGVDGAFVDGKGGLISPVIAWKCKRTIPVLTSIDKYFNKEDLFLSSGVGYFSFNTINKMIWYKENEDNTIQTAKHWLFISSLIGQRLTGEFYTDHTMAGTAQLCDLETQDFDTSILDKLGVEKSLFPPLKYAGETVGTLHSKGADLLGLPKGVEVKSVGHDTQFALFGAGMDEKNAVVSSGTWEILMVQSHKVDLTPDLMDKGITVEFDAQKGMYNVGVQWMASANIEWLRSTFFKDLPSETVYDVMIAEAKEAVETDVSIVPLFQPDQSITLTGVGLTTTRGEISKAFFIALSKKLKEAITLLEGVVGFSIEKITCVGGGSKNAYWNQLKAEATNCPVVTIQEKETTVLGAAFFLLGGNSFEAKNVRQNYAYQFQNFTPKQEHITV